MNYPVLYSAGMGEKIGVLSDVISGSCKVVEQLNTSFEMSMQYPIGGSHFDDLKLYSVIKCKPNPYGNEQPFVIYKITKPLNGIVTIYAEHISYIMDNCVCAPYEFYADTESAVGAAMVYLQDSTYENTSGYSFGFSSSGITATKKWSFSKAVSMREARNTITNIFGGEWEFDGTDCTLKNQRGENRGVSVAYGVNMTDFNYEDNSTDKYTHIMAYWYGIVTDETTGTQEKVIQYADPIYTPISAETGYFRPYILDCSSYFAEKPTDLELNGKAVEFIGANPTMGYTSENYRVRFVQRNKTAEYPHLSDGDHVEIGDTIRIRENRYGVSDSRRCVKTTYDVCADRYTEIELGSVKQSISGFTAAASPKTNETTYGGGYTEKTDTTKQKSAVVKSKIVRSVDATKKDGVIQSVKIGYDDGSTTSYKCKYDDSGNLMSFGRVTISHTAEESEGTT